MKWKSLPLLIALLVVAGGAIAQSTITANQGAPGTKGPWPVTFSGSTVVSVDGGVIGTFPAQCGTRDEKVTSVGVAAGNTPSTQLADRYYIQLCVSLEETGNPLVKCTVDGVDPAIGEANPGDTLRIGSCVTYAVAAGVVPRCISDTAATAVTSYECGP